jgi:hypothetical protein
VTQLLYSDIKLNIEGELSLEPTRLVAHVGATLWPTLAGRADEGVGGSLASRKPPPLCGEAGRHDVR